MIDNNQAMFEQMLSLRNQSGSQQQMLNELNRQRYEMQQAMQQMAQAAQAAQAQAAAVKAAQAEFTKGLMSQLQTMYNSNAAQLEQMGYSQLMSGASVCNPTVARFTSCVGYQPPTMAMGNGWACEEVRQPAAARYDGYMC